MTFDEFKEVFRRRGYVRWNGTRYKAIGIKCIRTKGEMICSVLVSSLDGRVNYWLDAATVEHDGKDRK